MPTDYANTTYAAKTRYEKAQALAAAAWEQGLTPEHILFDLDGQQWATFARRTTGKTASDETRRLTYCLLSVKEAWAAGHPEHPDAHRTVRPIDHIIADLQTRRPRT